MNQPSCSASTSTVPDNDNQPGTSFNGRNERVDNSEEADDKSDTGDESPPNSVMQPEFRAALRRRLHHCIATMADRPSNRPLPRIIDFRARRLRNPERDVAMDHRRELRRLWMYLDAVAVVRLSRIPPAG